MSAAADTRPTYGNWPAHRSPGIWGLGLVGTLILFVGAVISMLSLLVIGWQAMLALLVVFGLVLVAVGTPVGAGTIRRARYLNAHRKGDHTFRSGMFNRTKHPENRLPGLLGKSRLLSGTDQFGGSFAVVRSPGGLYSIVARCSAEGPWMQDQDRVNGWVAGYSLLLASLGAEPGLVCVKAITDTAPDPGGKLQAMVANLRTGSGPDIARAVMDECVAVLPATSSDNVTYIEVTFRGREISRKGDQAVILSELGRKIQGLIGLIQSSGGGSVDMVTADELPRIVRVAYDPAVQTDLEQMEISGDVDQVEWHQAGPVACQDNWGDLLHDSGRSITWQMHGAPRAKITELAMSALLAPHSDFARKRVALLYRPHKPDESANVAERDARTANFTAQQGKKRPTALAMLRQKMAEQSRQEVAEGAAAVRFSLMVTATVPAGGDLDQAASTLTAKAGAAPIRLRRCYGSQAAAFAATLPAGFVPWEHTAVTPKLREWL